MSSVEDLEKEAIELAVQAEEKMKFDLLAKKCPLKFLTGIFFFFFFVFLGR